MKFDTEQAFFKATYNQYGNGAHQLAASFLGENATACRSLTGEIVKMMRAAFFVHQRCTASPSPQDSLLNYRVNRAEETLPEGWRIVVMVEAGSIRVDLYDPSDVLQDLPENDDTSNAVLMATEFAVNKVTETAAILASEPAKAAGRDEK